MKHASQLRLALAQINVVVGDVEGNAQKIIEWMRRRRDADSDIVTSPGLAVTGYPPEDWLLKPQFIINSSSSPYHAGKRYWRERMLATGAADNTVIVAYNNLVGGQDELVFDGDSLVFDENGDLLARGKQFQEDLVVVDLDIESVFRT